MKTQKHTTPLLSALAASMLCASLMATVSAHSIYEKYNTDGWSQPIISVLMQGLSHHDSPWESDRKNEDASLLADSQTNTGELPDVLAAQSDLAISGSTLTGQSDLAIFGDMSAAQLDSVVSDNVATKQHDLTASDGTATEQLDLTASGGAATGQLDLTASDSAVTGQPGSVSPDSPATGQPGSAYSDISSGQAAAPNAAALPQSVAVSDDMSQTEPRQYAFTEVTQEYFDDALFIGDSRVTGVQLYSGWDNLTYYAEGGMTIYGMFQCKAAKEGGKAISIEEALQQRSFGKIYLEIGINEMGTGTVDSFMEAYESAVEHLRELQPDAIIYVCGIMYVKQNKSESDPIFNNPAIQERNDRIAQLADGEHIFYLDINEVVTDETGNLNPAYTWDEIHLLGKYDMMWLEYFCSHGIVREDM